MDFKAILMVASLNCVSCWRLRDFCATICTHWSGGNQSRACNHAEELASQRNQLPFEHFNLQSYFCICSLSLMACSSPSWTSCSPVSSLPMDTLAWKCAWPLWELKSSSGPLVPKTCSVSLHSSTPETTITIYHFPTSNPLLSYSPIFKFCFCRRQGSPHPRTHQRRPEAFQIRRRHSRAVRRKGRQPRSLRRRSGRITQI